MKILLIDDDPVTLFLTKTLLQIEGLSKNVIGFEDPEKALEFLQQQIPAGEVPQVIFLDLNMPKISGWELLAALEPYFEQLQTKCHIYVLTSSLDPLDLDKAREHPKVKELIQKPLDRQKIRSIQKSMLSSG